MGNTIRRKPITFDIPKSPDYKYLNITNFNGLDMTDNLFAASHNTASDSLNVYVDEFGALTTRPRLEKKIDFGLENFTYYGVYELTDGYLIHGVHNAEYKIYLYTDELIEIGEGSGIIPTKTQLSIFEQNDEIYVLDAEKYQVIQNNTLNKIEGYTPTTSIGMYKRIIKDNGDVVVDKNGNNYEGLNILSNKYKESYFWDGETNLEDFLGSNGVIVKNDYIKKFVFGNEHDDDRYIRYVPDKTINNEHGCVLCANISLDDIYFKNIKDDEEHLPPLPEHETYTIEGTLNYFDSTINGDCVVALRTSGGSSAPDVCKGALYVYRDGVWEILIADPSIGFESANPGWFSGNRLQLSYDGSLITVLSTEGLHCFVYDFDKKEYVVLTKSHSDFLNGYFISGVSIASKINNTMCLELKNKSLDTGSKIFHALCILSIEKNNLVQKKILENISSNEYARNSIISPLGDKIAYATEILNVYDIENDMHTSYKNKISENTLIFFNENGNKILLHNRKGLEGFFLLDTKKYIPLNISIQDDSPISGLGNDIGSYATDTTIAIRIWAHKPYYYGVLLIKLDLYNKEPLLYVEKKITEDDEKYADWTKLREKFKNSFLTTRYQNNTWFECKDYVFYTQNNDPTYIPIYNYDILGNKNNKITGFNLAGDDILVCYMKNSMFIIQPTVINDISTYSFSESKNTVGNKAYGSPIVSTLSEIPLQINYDGIYALNQLQNIESSERVATLISNGIQPKWLAESKDSIDNLKTMNRLYWTYFVLTKDNFTKIYLLDNRNMSWYYWELPIKFLNAFTKDDAVEFVDYEGVVYSFKTSDIINKYNPSLTEYYDDGEKIINWYWKSQILPLGTINYSKKLLESTFIVADTDDSDEFGFNYKFKVFRKLANETNTTTITNKLNLIQSTTKRTLVPRFNFIQLELSNVEDDLNNNKMRLLGIGLKYTLLEALR